MLYCTWLSAVRDNAESIFMNIFVISQILCEGKILWHSFFKTCFPKASFQTNVLYNQHRPAEMWWLIIKHKKQRSWGKTNNCNVSMPGEEWMEGAVVVHRFVSIIWYLNTRLTLRETRQIVSTLYSVSFGCHVRYSTVCQLLCHLCVNMIEPTRFCFNKKRTKFWFCIIFYVLFFISMDIFLQKNSPSAYN